MQQINSFNLDRTIAGISSEVDYGSDPASGGFFSADYKKHEDLKQMLDSSKDSLKLEAMKRIISMVAKGRDASELFPAVVKNVVSKNIEVKKLVYVFLMRYAEEQQDLALLSISTFQRALKDPNQLIRASALRVLSSIRVSIIVPIVMLAIRESASDMSPYVRKTASHAIPKLYSLDPEQKEELVAIIDRLLGDKTTLVFGSAVMAFDEVCPERVDLIHKNFRKLCYLLVDVDEWGQVIIINMLTRYARTQFTNPNIEELHSDGKFYSDASSENEDHEFSIEEQTNAKERAKIELNIDHKLLLRQTKPLLQSRNAAVVMAVSQLFHHLAPKNEVMLIAKALIRHLRSYKEIQSVVLTCVASLTITRKYIFEPHLKSFFVRNSDPTHIKLLKLEILTNLATELTISVILREFQTYIANSDNNFVAATIQAIGRCAASIVEISEKCLNGLIHLLSSKNEYVVAESVVVIKRLLQSKTAKNCDIISQMAKLLNFITIPAARASIIWVIGEYTENDPKIAPDVLRKLAKSFSEEENIVKMQILNLTIKLYLTNPINNLLHHYIFNLARYDQNYDIRDRARLLKYCIHPQKNNSLIAIKARNVFFSAKPYPTAQSKHIERIQFQLGSLSHYINVRATGYKDLPNFPDIAPDPSVRNVDMITNQNTLNNYSSQNKLEKENITLSREKNLSESSDYSETSSESDSEKSSDLNDYNYISNITDEDVENRKTNSSLKKSNLIFLKTNKNKLTESQSTNSSIDSDDTSDESSEESSFCNSDCSRKENVDNDIKSESTKKLNIGKSKDIDSKYEIDSLLKLDNMLSNENIMTPSREIPFTDNNHLVIDNSTESTKIELVGSSYDHIDYKELLNKMTGRGLEILYRYTRNPHLHSEMLSIELLFKNHSQKTITNIHMDKIKNIDDIDEFTEIDVLNPMQTYKGFLGIKCNDSLHQIEFEIIFNLAERLIVRFKPRVGELMRSIKISENSFRKERLKLRGMSEHQCSLENIKSLIGIEKKLFRLLNVGIIESTKQEEELLFAGQTLCNKHLVLLSAELLESNVVITVNSENVVLGSLLLTEIKNNCF